MKQKSKKLILLLIISFAMILGFATIVNAADDVSSVTCANYRSKIGLLLGEHDSEALSVVVKDGEYKDVSNPDVEWKSSDTSVVTVDSKGVIKAVKAGTAKVTATVSDKSAEFEITVIEPSFTDFSNAKIGFVAGTRVTYNLQINNIKPQSGHSYYYMITSQNQKPKIELNPNGSIKNFSDFGSLIEGNKNDELHDYNAEKYIQLNQDMYLWVIEGIYNSQTLYKDDNGNDINWMSRVVVAGQKLERPKYPVYAEMFFATFMTNDSNQIVFNLPWYSDTKRNFTLKIGKITDKNILNGIKNNKGKSWNSLLEYAKNSKAVFNKKLSIDEDATSPEYIANKDNGKEIIKIDNLEDKAYYYMYVVFDDENGKYYPASGLTIAKATVIPSQNYWGLFFLGDDEFKWDDFGVNQTGTATVDGNTTGTTRPTSLPRTGSVAIGLVIVAMIGTAVFFKVKNNEYKGI